MPKPIIEELASSLGRRDEVPNTALAVKIAKSGTAGTMRELLALLDHKTVGVRSDAIKVVYEVAERNIHLVLPFTPIILKLLDHKDNRVKWGAMHALSAISRTKPELLVPHTSHILKAMDEGSVITRDHGIIILSQMATLKKHHADMMELLLEQIEKAPVNQVPSYAEKTAAVISAPFVSRLVKILKSRGDALEIPSKEKRIRKLMKEMDSFSKKDK